jgi:homoisocitrate dehydrogenase
MVEGKMGNVLLCTIEGDGIGHEVIPAAVQVLHAVVPDLEVVPAEAGWECFRRRGTSVPDETLQTIRDCGAALFGAVASPAHKVEGYRSAIVTLRQALDLYANVRPVRSWPLPDARPEVDLIIVRENTEGLYVGRERLEGDTAVAERVITRRASRRVAQVAFELACRGDRRRVTIVHKANILPVTDGLFRDTVRAVAADYPDIEVDELLVDTAALWLVRDPTRFDVVVTTNLYGDILSDAAAAWGGGLGMAPSLNWGDGVAVAEPVHGAAPDIAGRGIANPIAAILSGALLLRYVWNRPAEADAIEGAVEAVLADGLRTPDIAGPGERVVGTARMVEAIRERL